MAAQADAGVWQKVAPAAVEGLATAAQAADAVAWQKAASVAVEGREHAISVVSLVHSAQCVQASGSACVPYMYSSRTVHVRCGGCAWRSCVCIPTPTAE